MVSALKKMQLNQGKLLRHLKIHHLEVTPLWFISFSDFYFYFFNKRKIHFFFHECICIIFEIVSEYIFVTSFSCKMVKEYY